MKYIEINSTYYHLVFVALLPFYWHSNQHGIKTPAQRTSSLFGFTGIPINMALKPKTSYYFRQRFRFTLVWPS